MTVGSPTPSARLARALLPVMAIFSLAAVAACQQGPQAGQAGQASEASPAGEAGGRQLSAAAEFKQSQDQFGKATQRLLKEARPINDKAALAARLKLDPARVRVIKTGGASSTTARFESGTNCKFGHCTCVGDSDCNDMFSTICASASTDGSCETVGNQVICTCRYVDAR